MRGTAQVFLIVILICHPKETFYRLCLLTIAFGSCFYIEIADCIWESWGDWSVCSQSCGGGKRIRTRMVATHETKGGNCNGEFSEEEEVAKESKFQELKWWNERTVKNLDGHSNLETSLIVLTFLGEAFITFAVIMRTIERKNFIMVVLFNDN